MFWLNYPPEDDENGNDDQEYASNGTCSADNNHQCCICICNCICKWRKKLGQDWIRKHYLNVSTLVCCRQSEVPSSGKANRSIQSNGNWFLLCCHIAPHSSHRCRPLPYDYPAAIYGSSWWSSTGCSPSRSSCPLLLGLLLQSRWWCFPVSNIQIRFNLFLHSWVGSPEHLVL